MNNRIITRIPSFVALILLFSFLLCGCIGNNTESDVKSITIINGGRVILNVGDSVQLNTDIPKELSSYVEWTASNGSVTVTDTGLVTALDEGKAAVTATYKGASDTAMIEVTNQRPSSVLDPYADISKEAFYAHYKPAKSFADSYYRTLHGLMSGSITVPDQEPDVSAYRPTSGNYFIRNKENIYPDKNSYTVTDAYGKAVFTVYRGGAYITLEEVAAYVYAFGDVPANYVESKNEDPQDSIWGEYLRLNHTKFSGNTNKYPYEPKLPNINGCGGDLQYYEIDIGTTGTDCDPGYQSKIYNDGRTITRGAARIVYARYDKNKNLITEPNEKYLFYTYNHYNDFTEYLNYYGGWGETFGNITGGGSISSKTDYNPTPYVPSVLGSLYSAAASAYTNSYTCIFIMLPPRKYA